MGFKRRCIKYNSRYGGVITKRTNLTVGVEKGWTGSFGRGNGVTEVLWKLPIIGEKILLYEVFHVVVQKCNRRQTHYIT